MDKNTKKKSSTTETVTKTKTADKTKSAELKTVDKPKVDTVNVKAVEQPKMATADIKSVDKLNATTAAKQKTIQRLQNVPRISTKDTNLVESVEGAIKPTIDLNIDKSMFEDNDSTGNLSAKQVSASRSVTIDGTMLSQERASSAKRQQKKALSMDIELAERYNPDYAVGLSGAQVLKRKSDGYVNYTKSKSGKSYGRIFFSNIFTFFNLLTFVVGAALIAVGASLNQFFFVIIISANIAIGIIQEVRSKITVSRLNLITAPSALVIRDGERKAVPIAEMVLDDIMYLEMGKQICSDAIVIKGDIEVNESMLTGESIPMRKTAGGELFSGSFVTSGSCYARVNKVGKANYVETLTSYAKKYRKPKSELQNSIRLIIKVVAIILIPLAIVMLLNNIKVFAYIIDGKERWREIVTTVAGAVIGMIPAGMFLLTSTALAVSVMRLAKKKTLVQDLYCIEMLARVDVLCLDKTGTITDGTMQVNNIIEIKGGEVGYSLNDIIGSMLTASGDNNQTAMALANKFGYSQALRPTAVLPFSSQRKLSAVSFEGAGTFMLGAPEFVLKDMGIRIEKIVNENASNGFRVMVLAHAPTEIIGDKLPTVRRPMCLIVIEDHIREDAVATIKWFKENNVAVKVISGDNPITVSEVAKRVGVPNAELYISLEGKSNQEVIESAGSYTVFGRVTPEQKRLLVKALKAKGHTVAMTGDGVNDILAMREADCSIAIASGAEAARNVSHLVLLDSNFTSMPDVVMEGRRVVNNIQKSSSLFLMKTFMSMALSVIFLILRKPYPFKTEHMLLLELFVIGLASFVLALQPNKNIIRGRFLTNVLGRCVPGGITLVISIMAIYIYNEQVLHLLTTDPTYITMLVLALTFTGIIILYQTCEPFDTTRTILLISVFLLTLVMIIFLPEIFGISGIALREMLFVITVVLGCYFIVSIMMKALRGVKLLN